MLPAYFSEANVDEREAWLAANTFECPRLHARISKQQCEANRSGENKLVHETCKNCCGWKGGDMNVISPEKLTEITHYLKEGKTIREIERITGCSKNTVNRYAKLSGIEALCPCGRPSGHKGWCKHRLENSPTRQALMESPKMKKGGRVGLSQSVIEETARAIYQGDSMNAVASILGITKDGLLYRIRGHKLIKTAAIARGWYVDPKEKYQDTPIMSNSANNISGKGQGESQTSQETKTAGKNGDMLDPSNEIEKSYVPELPADFGLTEEDQEDNLVTKELEAEVILLGQDVRYLRTEIDELKQNVFDEVSLSDSQDSELYKIKLEKLRTFPQFDPGRSQESQKQWFEAFTIMVKWVNGTWPSGERAVMQPGNKPNAIEMTAPVAAGRPREIIR